MNFRIMLLKNVEGKLMKKSTRSLSCLITVLTLSSGSAFATPLPDALTHSLEQHETSISHLTIDWEVSHKDTASADRKAAPKHLRSIAEITSGLRKNGINDPMRLQRMIADAQKSDTQQASVADLSTSATWKFSNDGPATLVSGSGLNSSTSALQFRQFYSGGNGVVINDPNPNALQMALLPTMVWARPGDSRDYPVPTPFSLSLLPEQFVLLDGANPLDAYGARWSVESVTSDATMLLGKVAQSSGGPLTLRVTLSSAHDNLPSDMSITADRQPWKRELKVVSFRKNGDGWLPEKVIMHLDAPRIVQVDEVYTLKSVTPSRPVHVMIPDKGRVRDYRLLGTALTQGSVLQAELQHRHTIVDYPWKGHLPDLDELRRIQEDLYPGEASPDPNPTTANIQVLGGLMALVGAVWMFKRRGGPA